MKILSFNVRVWTRDTNKKDKIYWKTRMDCISKFIVQESPDIICFQELSYPATKYLPNGYKRIGLTVSHPIYVKKDKFQILKHCFKIHLDYAKLKINNTYYHIINVHSHWNKDILKKNCKQINNIISDIDVNSKRNKIIICGDWNNEYETLIDKNISGNLFDNIYLHKNNEYTFLNFKTGKQAEIDFFATRNVNSGKIKVWDKNIFDANGELITIMSDHNPLTLEY